MKMTKFTKILSVLLCLALVVAIAVFATGCANKKTEEPSTTAAPATTEAAAEGVTELGQGEALLDNGLIAGDESDYGLYVKTVNGTTLDYDADKMYWAFYVDGAYAEKGVDATEIVDGATYSFVATEG